MIRILIADDQEGWRKFNTEAVYKILGENTDIETASSAEEGYTKYLNSFDNPYDYIITDMQMENSYAPKMAGEWLIEQVQSLKYSYKTKIIIISASPHIKIIAEKYNVDYISKRNALTSIEPYKELLKH